MSADDLKTKFSQVRLRGSKRDKLADLIEKRQWKRAADLKQELDGPLARGNVVSLDSSRPTR